MSSILDQESSLVSWVHQLGITKNFSIASIPGDASTRLYYRIKFDHDSCILIDSSSNMKSYDHFINLSSTFKKIGVNVPDIFYKNLKMWWAILSDFGDKKLCDRIDIENSDMLYKKFFKNMLSMQKNTDKFKDNFPSYDHGIYSYIEEISWFSKWYVKHRLKTQLSHQDEKKIYQMYEKIISHISDQQQTIIHRDFHCKNIMMLGDNETLGILDYQDASVGSITYDLASLLCDCYQKWDMKTVYVLVQHYYGQVRSEGFLKKISPDEFIENFNLCCLHRLLKCLGLFIKLNVYKNIDRYLKYIPNIIFYLENILKNYVPYEFIYKLIMVNDNYD